MEKLKIYLLLIVACMGFSTKRVTAQSNLATVQQIMNNIYLVYDSANYLTFDIAYSYSSDTMPDGKFIDDKITGTYTMAGKKAKYNLGDIDFMQNESFFIAVYKDEKYILVSDPRNSAAASGLPARNTIDSMLQAYSTHYNISVQNSFDISTPDSTGDADTTIIGHITFTKADSIAQFQSFSISYDTSTGFLQAIEYSFEEPYNPADNFDSSNTNDSLSLNEDTYPNLVQHKKLLISFANYRIDNFSSELYNEEQFIYFEDDTWKPVEKYEGFRVFNSWTGGQRLQYTNPAAR